MVTIHLLCVLQMFFLVCHLCFSLRATQKCLVFIQSDLSIFSLMASKCFVMFRKDFFRNLKNSPIVSPFLKGGGVIFNSEIFDQTSVCLRT